MVMRMMTNGAADAPGPAFHELVPWFILGFLIMAAARSFSLIPDIALAQLATQPVYSPRYRWQRWGAWTYGSWRVQAASRLPLRLRWSCSVPSASRSYFSCRFHELL